MATVTNLLVDINLRYRNTFTDAQIVVWMNEEQRDLFEILEIDSAPYSFNTVADQFLYPINAGIDIDRIKELSIQINDNDTPDFLPLPFKRLSDEVDVSEYWYTLVEQNFYVNVPSGAVNDRVVYIYLNSQTTDIVSTTLGIEPAIPVRYQELLKIGTLRRIAAARKDTIMRNNFDAEYQEKIQDVQWKMKMDEPNFNVPTDVTPRLHDRYFRYRRCR